MASGTSSISQAFALNADAINIPKPHIVEIPSVEEAHAVKSNMAGNQIPAQKDLAAGLLTPPNSISPNLPAHGLSVRALKENNAGAMSPPSQVDSDIDLQDALEHAKHDSATYGNVELSGSDAYGNITPAYLAKYHLPGIFLGKGPIAIRHAMNSLSKTVPGFAEIPPAKARRIVVGALESRGGGGPQGDVEFEKVGWGRWLARVRPSRDHQRPMQTIREGHASTAPVAIPLTTTNIPCERMLSMAMPPHSKTRRTSHGSWTAESTMSSRSDQHEQNLDVDMAEHEADKMSVDGDLDHASTRYLGAGDMAAAVEEQACVSDTEEEDWGSIGAAALRGNSYGSPGNCHTLPLYHGNKRRARRKSPHGRRSYSSRINTNSLAAPLAQSSKRHQTPTFPMIFDFTGIDASAQEREAIEALMRMGSM